MADAAPTRATRRTDEHFSARPPRWGFWKGAATGLILEIPLTALTVWLLARCGIGNDGASLRETFRLTTLFTGIAAVFTAGGIGRLTAQASVERGGGRRRAIWVGARTHAVASAGLVLIATIPHGHLPDVRWKFAYVMLAGAGCGALIGAAIGAVCGRESRVTLGDVVGLARVPTETLKEIFQPDELLRIGSVVRGRATDLVEGVFDGLFDPAAPRPAATEELPAQAAPSAADKAARPTTVSDGVPREIPDGKLREPGSE